MDYATKALNLIDLSEKNALVFSAEHNKRKSQIYHTKGLAQHNLKEYDDAIKCYDKALEINPNYKKVLDDKDASLQEKKKFKDAERRIDEAKRYS